LREKHPDAAVACYVNTSAKVKAECDVCFTSANALKIINALPQQEVLCLPDKLMATNLAAVTSKNILGWDGTCIVHERFSVETIKEVRKYFPDAKILVHTECNSDVVAEADVAGGTTDMVDAIKSSEAGSTFMIVTECGLADRMRVEFPDKNFVGTCHLCPYMKKNTLKNVLQSLKNPTENQIITLDEHVRLRAKKTLDVMFSLSSTPV